MSESRATREIATHPDNHTDTLRLPATFGGLGSIPSPGSLKPALKKPEILDLNLETLVRSKSYGMSYMQAARELYFMTRAKLEVLEEEESHACYSSTILRHIFEEAGDAPGEPGPSRCPPRMRKFEKEEFTSLEDVSRADSGHEVVRGK